MIRIESIGSYWEIDEALLRYRRWPKTEQPRENGWGSIEAGALEDLVWHDYISWGVIPPPFMRHHALLRITLSDDSGAYVKAPLTDEEAEKYGLIIDRSAKMAEELEWFDRELEMRK